MDLKSDCPVWLIKNGLLHTYPAIEQDLAVDVALLGGGITGALVADRLTKAGMAACSSTVAKSPAAAPA